MLEDKRLFLYPKATGIAFCPQAFLSVAGMFGFPAL
jgi:hypothetical protein